MSESTTIPTISWVNANCNMLCRYQGSRVYSLSDNPRERYRGPMAVIDKTDDSMTYFIPPTVSGDSDTPTGGQLTMVWPTHGSTSAYSPHWDLVLLTSLRSNGRVPTELELYDGGYADAGKLMAELMRPLSSREEVSAAE